MQVEDVNKMVEEAIDQFAGFVRDGQEFNHAETTNSAASADDPVAGAKETQLVQTEGQSALMKDDLVYVPEGEQFDKCVISAKFSAAQENPTYGLMCPVIRAGKFLVLRVFLSTFTRGIRPLDARGNEAKEFKYPDGTACQAVRNNVGSVYEALKVLSGKVLKVEAKDKIRCNVIKRGSSRDPETGRYPTEPGTQNMYKISFVKKETWTEALKKA
jgi:hypothetical protein